MFVESVWTGLLTVLVLRVIPIVNAETSLTPPYFNLAEGRKVTATATCGVDTEGPELYCKLVGANAENDLNVNVIQGQFCDVCDPTRPDKMHPPEFAVDGMETWWQSPPLSRGMKYNEVNLTIDLGQEFHVAYVFIRMGNSPRPGLWVLEKSADYGNSYTPWQYFSDSPDDCETYFGRESLRPISRDDSVICTTEYSKIVPLEGGEIPISLLNNRPSANQYFNSTVLQEWTRATNVRLRLLRTKNFLGHLMSVARQDPTVTRRYFYSIKDISIGGRCMCNGHADTCDIQDSQDPSILLCRCQHNTCGAKCDSCCPGYEQKKWRQSKIDDPFVCEPCNCFQHSYQCIYDEEVDRKRLSLDIHGRYEGGGVCQNCHHNTDGINCNKCKPTFYRPYNKHWNETDVCQPCSCDYFYSTGNCAEGSGLCECRKEFQPPNCDKCSFGYFGYPDCRPCECFLNGTKDLQCEAQHGECPCLYNFGGQYCKECAPGYYNFPTCKHCECNPDGSVTQTCEQESGNCTCKNNFGGKHCDECQAGYYNYPTCSYCNCDIKGTQEGICNKETGQCICKEGYGGERCDSCILGYYGYPDCKPCNCSKEGSLGFSCSATGKCQCSVNYAGRTCDQCSPGYYKYPECLPCECDSHGSNGVSCDNEGKCECHYNFAGLRCDTCREGFYNFPACEDCNCHPAGVVAGFAGCGSVPAGELCQCKERVEGRICNKCRPLYWNLNPNNPQGCEECNCNIPGVLGGIAVCDSDNGECICKSLVVARGCSECADGTYNLQEENLFGCSDCDCDVGGSVNNICDKTSGQCLCQSRVTGRTCKEPLQAHYFPTLYQYQYEVEDGRSPTNTLVRYANDEHVFPEYSWKGYAVFSLLQNKILQDIHIYKPSLYRMILRYVNPSRETVIGKIKVTPDNPSDNEQEFGVQFKNSSIPAFVTVSGSAGNTPSAFVMNPGRWQIGIEVHKNLLLDYFVLLPEDFYLATILNKKVEKPCTIEESGLCREYTYLNLTQFPTTFGVGGYVQEGRIFGKLREYFQDTDHLSKIGIANRVPVLNLAQPNLSFNVTVNKPGQYVVIINYVTPRGDQRTHKIEANLRSGRHQIDGKAILYSCSYSTLCRQVITTLDGIVAIQQVDGNEIAIKLHSTNADVGIHSVVAIPYDEWSLGYIKPKSVCIKKDGHCIPASFRNPPETKKIQFEENNIPLSVNVANATYMLLNPNHNTLDLKGKVPNPGYYTFVVHYYQPNYEDFDLKILMQNGQFYEATLPVYYCPSLSGCRAIIKQEDGNTKFQLTENFMLTLQEPGNRNVYLDYLLVIPADFHNERYLEEEDVDRTGEFISTCGHNHFNINTTVDGFCRDSVFSITAGHNSGALPCQCDYDGSLSFECDKFGGQCQCKPNIIGRKCEACKTGYFGFPDCKPCNCPSIAYCEPTTGQCICPPHVVGEKCDQCEPLTYGYDQIIGCEECKCNILGIQGSEQCDLNNGSCACKENVVGRQCDKCLAGHYAFPYCEYCACDTRGTTNEICDQQTAECFCKKNVVGPQCETCREGTFNLQELNQDGCTECFCFGKTTRCISSKLIRIPVMQMAEWQLVGLNFSTRLEIFPLNLTVQDAGENTTGAVFEKTDTKNNTVYFTAPREYTGKKLTTYGGFLNYTLYYTITPGEGSAVSEFDVVLEGRKTYLSYSSYEQPTAAVEYHASVQLVEDNFELPTGIPARRDHMMEVLEDLRGIYIRATYWTASVTTRLSNVIQDDAVSYQYYIGDNRNLLFANAVEECRCPEAYTGLSCEECAPGFYRIDTGPHGGYCVPCQCHGHATECDVNTGICLNCAHNTRGDHCELCEVGYHGNALAGTPMDCLICACPLPVASNNFATACDVSSDGEKISCECIEGYFGARCQSCAAGYYGRPEVLNETCKPCQCSGNINPEDPSSCDTVSGECLRCLNNTFGKACALCAPGYFGDAVVLKDCQSCICDELGTDHCNSFTGECVCKPNVIGEKCDRCEDTHFGFQSGAGCGPCDCAEASESARCDDVTGQCRCKPGVAGRACDRCAAGFWNYTEDGCVSCGCKSDYSRGFGCNALTGQCECLQGVVGEKCDQCPHRWVFVQDYGCHQCDSCTHALLDDTDNLRKLIDPIIVEFDSAHSGYFTRRKLESMRELLKELEPKFEDIDPKQINLDIYVEELQTLEQDSKNLNRKANYSLENSDSLKTNSIDSKEKAELLLDDIQDAEDYSIRVIEGIDKITFQLNKDENPEIESAVEEGIDILNAIKRYNLTERENITNLEIAKVDALLTNVTNFKIPVEYLDEKTEKLKNDMKSFNKKLDDLYNQTQFSLNNANEAQRIIDKSGKDRLKKKLEDIEHQTKEFQNNLDKSQTLNENATKANVEASVELQTLQNILNEIEVHNNEIRSVIDNNDIELEEVNNLGPKVSRHAKNLTGRAMELDNLLTESRDLSGGAVRAVEAYRDIVAAVKNASQAAQIAKGDADSALALLQGIGNKTYFAAQNSSESLKDAFELYHSTNDDLKPRLDSAIESYKPAKETQKNNEDILNNINKILDNIHKKSLDEVYGKAADTADDAMRYVTNIEKIDTGTFDKLKNETGNATILPKVVDDMNRDLLQTKKQLNIVNEKLPTIVETMDQIPQQQERLQDTVDKLENSLKKLNQQIILARDLANQIKIGMKFYPNTTLELKNPSNLEELSTSERISGYFKTDKLDGLVWYLGNPVGTNLRRTKSDDYMALIIQNGYPVLKLDVGNGLEQVINDKFVADDVWYQFIIDRTGHNAKLTIREELPGGIENITQNEITLDGPLSVFNLDRNKSKLFVGSYPDQYTLQKEVDVVPFDGEIEDLVIGEKPVSLWNFNYGFENNHGAIERDKLINLQPSTGFRFNGNGYVVLNARSFTWRSRSDIQLSFKTFAKDGLLFLAGKGKTFTAIEMRNGRLLYQYNLGHSTKLWQSSRTYNDGQWHMVEARRDGANGRFTIDNENIDDITAPIDGHAVEAVETVSIGGYPGRHMYGDVTNIKFDGCIDHVVIMGSTIDLRNNVKAYDVTPGCPAKYSQMVSFDQHPGYVAQSGISVGNDFKISFKFKTKEKNGLLFYSTDQLRTASISLSLKDGKLNLISQKLHLESTGTYDDSDWHVVSVMHNDRELRIDFDDIDQKVATSPPQLYYLHGTLYIGGVPSRIVLPSGTVASSAPFKGCIRDLTVKGNVVNFANISDRANEILGKCIYDENYKAIDKIDSEPELPPLEPIEPVTTVGYDDMTREHEFEHTTIRGDGGLDYWNNRTEEEVPVTEIVQPEFVPPITEGHVGRAPPTTPKPPPEDACALPLHPPKSPSGVYRFGAQKDSRLEIDKLRGKYKKSFEFAIEFKSDFPDGIIFYMCNNELHTQYVAVFLENGQIVYTFSDKGARTVIKTDSTTGYSDDKWHLVEFSRNENGGKLVLDGKIFSKQEPNMQKFEIRPPIYVGGLNPEHYNQIHGNLNITRSFSGCIKNLNMNSKPLEVSSANQIGVVPCFDNVESGAFFPGSGGFVRLKEPRFKVGDVFNVKLDIKPRRDSGVLIAVNGRKDFFVLEMINGEMSLTVENGNGPIRAVYNPYKKFYFCDGQWHSVQAVKSKNVITLSVDNVFTDPSLGDHSSVSTDTGSALFLGGHRYLNTPRAKGILTKLPYVGCIKNVVINDEPIEIHANMAEGDVIVGTCPTD